MCLASPCQPTSAHMLPASMPLRCRTENIRNGRCIEWKSRDNAHLTWRGLHRCCMGGRLHGMKKRKERVGETTMEGDQNGVQQAAQSWCGLDRNAPGIHHDGQKAMPEMKRKHEKLGRERCEQPETGPRSSPRMKNVSLAVLSAPSKSLRQWHKFLRPHHHCNQKRTPRNRHPPDAHQPGPGLATPLHAPCTANTTARHRTSQPHQHAVAPDEGKDATGHRMAAGASNRARPDGPQAHARTHPPLPNRPRRNHHLHPQPTIANHLSSTTDAAGCRSKFPSLEGSNRGTRSLHRQI